MPNDKRASFELAKAAGLALDRFPETKQEADIAEDVLAQELAKLSLQDHELALFDLHGLTEALEETEHLLLQKLNEMEDEIGKIEERQAYDLAESMSPAYVKGRALRLMFLRSELMDAKAAAEKLVLHFHMKQKLFGKGEVLAREVEQSDLGPAETQILESGHVQVLPSRDASGRAILFISTDAIDNYPTEWNGEQEVRRTTSQGG